MQAIILAGGKGVRLRPYTTVFPKPLMPIGGYPILEIVIKQLKYFGFNNLTFAVGYLKELLQAFFNNGQKWNLNISYSFEEKPLGTAAPIKLINNFQDDFLVMNGDVLTDLNYADFFEYHKKHGAICTIAFYNKKVDINLGVLEISDSNEVINYIEKPILNYKVSMGVYGFSKEVLNYIPENTYFDLPDLVKTLIKNKKLVVGYPFHGEWLDIGTPVDYEFATEIFESQKDKFLRSL